MSFGRWVMKNLIVGAYPRAIVFRNTKIVFNLNFIRGKQRGLIEKLDKLLHVYDTHHQIGLSLWLCWLTRGTIINDRHIVVL